MIKACFVHSWGYLSGNSSGKIPDVTTLWCSTSRTVWPNAFVDHGGFQLQAAINSSCSSLWTPAVCYTVNWHPFTSIWAYSHPTACCFLFLLLPVLRTIFKCGSWVICLVAALAALWWTNLYLHFCCVPRIAVFDVAPANLPEFDPLLPGGSGAVWMTHWCGTGEEDDNERKWEALRTILLASCQNGISSTQHDRYTQDESCWVWLQVAGISHRRDLQLVGTMLFVC